LPFSILITFGDWKIKVFQSKNLFSIYFNVKTPLEPLKLIINAKNTKNSSKTQNQIKNK